MLRIATFNMGASRMTADGLQRALLSQSGALKRCAAILQRVRPDLLLINEFDHDGEGLDQRNLHLWLNGYLGLSQDGDPLLEYPYAWLIPTNTGLLSSADLDGDGLITLPGDAQGFGHFHGQFAMLLLSRYPIDRLASRSFRELRWRDLPGAFLPDAEPGSGLGDFYSPAALDGLRLSSKNHLDACITLPDGRVLHLLLSHPTPPVFDGPERRNLHRNHDEIRLWCDYLDNADWLVDDQGRRGGLAPDARFIVLGDLNADPISGDGDPGAIRRLLAHPRIHQAVAQGDLTPCSNGAQDWGMAEGRAHADAAHWTHLRGLRLDYVLPDARMSVQATGVFWPADGEAGRHWLVDSRGRERPDWSSDHRLVWLDVAE